MHHDRCGILNWTYALCLRDLWHFAELWYWVSVQSDLSWIWLRYILLRAIHLMLWSFGLVLKNSRVRAMHSLELSQLNLFAACWAQKYVCVYIEREQFWILFLAGTPQKCGSYLDPILWVWFFFLQYKRINQNFGTRKVWVFAPKSQTTLSKHRKNFNHCDKGTPSTIPDCGMCTLTWLGNTNN